jgi:chromosome segregation ATPase
MIMTQDKALKNAIRARMAAAGEPYSVARRVILADDAHGDPTSQDQASGPDAAGDDYYAQYSREAREAGVPEADIAGRLQAMMADEQADEAVDDVQAFAARVQQAADRAQQAADRAEELADQAEEAADQAEERAGRAEEAAEMAQEWADPDEQALAGQRADRMRERCEQAREMAERAREEAERAQERAELAQEAADQAWTEVDEADEADEPDEFDDEDDDLRAGPDARFGWRRPPRLPRPPRPPRMPRPPLGPDHGPRTGPDRLLHRLDELQHRLGTVWDLTDRFLDRLGQEPDKDRGDR